MPRIIEEINVHGCGCYTQRITGTRMGETIVYDIPVICSEHW